MKKIRLCIFTLLLASVLLLPTGITTAQLKATLEGHTDNVWSVAFSPNGKMLASADWDQTVRLWNVNTGRLLHTLTEHTNEVLSVAFSPDGNTLASADWDGRIHLWNPNNGKLKRTLTGHAGGVPSVVFSPDGQTLASGSADRTVRLWNPNNGKLKTTLTGHTNTVDAVAFSSDGNLLASGSRDYTIRLWNPNNGKHLKTLREHTDEVQRIAFSPDGNLLASGSRDDTVRLWNPKNGKLKTTLIGHRGWTKPVAFSPDGETLLIGGRGISVWDIQTNQYKIPLATDIWDSLSVVFSPDGEMVASGSADQKVHVFDLTRYVPDVPFVNIAFDINNIPEPISPPVAVRNFFELDPFYQQWINVGGLPLLASAKVNPYAMKEAAWLIWQMIGHDADVLKALAESQDRIYLLAIDEAFSDLPEYAFADHPTSFLNAFVRDIVISDPVHGMLLSEENLLRPDSHFGHALIHEFAHKIHGGLKLLRTEFDNRLKIAYEAAMQKGLWRGYYAASNRDEYWAEGTNSWFHSTQTNAVNTRSALKKYDPVLAKLLTEIYGDNNLLYTPPATRTHLPHLQGFNPQEALTFDGPYPWQIGRQELDKQLKDPNSDGDGKWVNLKLYDPSELPNLLASTTKGSHTGLFYVNLTGHEISFYFLDDDGSENLAYRGIRWIFDLVAPAGTIWLAKDHMGEDLAVFRAGEKTGRVFFGSSSNKIETDVDAADKPPSDTTVTVNVADVNKDGTVNAIDLLLVVTALSENATPHPRTDANGDGAVNVADLLLVIENLDDPVNAAAPSSKEVATSMDPAMLEGQLNILRAESDGSRKYQKAIALLQSLLAATRPTKTQLLANYPNPFNPETWIPYQLSEPAEVTLHIYAIDGRLIQRLALGHQPAGMYQSRTRAAYWNGRNAVGEPVASGIYFYTVFIGEFTATRKMLIRK